MQYVGDLVFLHYVPVGGVRKINLLGRVMMYVDIHDRVPLLGDQVLICKRDVLVVVDYLRARVAHILFHQVVPHVAHLVRSRLPPQVIDARCKNRHWFVIFRPQRTSPRPPAAHRAMSFRVRKLPDRFSQRQVKITPFQHVQVLFVPYNLVEVVFVLEDFNHKR